MRDPPGRHLYCWGANGSGELGNGGSSMRYAAVEVSGGFTDWTTVSAGGYTTCARRKTGRLYCWGGNYAGQVGDGTTTNRAVPTEVSGARTDWSAVSVGTDHTCALRKNHSISCWGEGEAGEVGDASGLDRNAPADVYVP